MRTTRRRLATLTCSAAALALMVGCSTDSPDVPTDPATQGAVTEGAPPGDTVPPSAPIDVDTNSDAAPAVDLVLTRDDDYSTTQSGVTLNITCDGGGDIDIDANDVQLQVTGDCQDIDVDGNTNTVDADNVDDLDVDGNGNVISGNNIRSIDVDGDTNTVRVQSATEIDVEGNGNTVTYATGQPSIDNEGDNNIAVG